MEERARLGQIDVGLVDCMEDPITRLERRRGRLRVGNIAASLIEHDDVGERPADVNREDVAHQRPSRRRLARQRSLGSRPTWTGSPRALTLGCERYSLVPAAEGAAAGRRIVCSRRNGQ